MGAGAGGRVLSEIPWLGSAAAAAGLQGQVPVTLLVNEPGAPMARKEMARIQH